MRANCFKPKVLSRHPSHKELRKMLKKHISSKLIILRLGSLTIVNSGTEINTIDGVKNSSDKLKMKKCFDNYNVTTAKWTNNISDAENLKFPIIAKHRFGSRGTGNYKIESIEELNSWKNGKNLKMYIFEEYVPYSKEYRIYCTDNEILAMARKMLRNGENGTQRHLDNSNFVYEYIPDEDGNLTQDKNEQFQTPSNIEDIKKQACLAIKSVGLQIGCIDLKVQYNSVNGIRREYPKFIVIETNSAPSCGKVLTKILYNYVKNFL